MTSNDLSSSVDTSIPDSLCVHVVLAPRLNLADFQNAVPLICELRVVNGTEQQASNLELALQAEPSFIKGRSWHLDAVAPGQEIRIRDLDVPLDGSVFQRLTEAERAVVHFELRTVGADTPQVELFQEVELLPRNQWGGISHVPELLAAFVQPNDPAVDRILKQAAEFLRIKGIPSALDGYKGGAKRAWELASAIWHALATLQLDYALPPSSFEQFGQKVRGPSQILDSGLATCLDLTLLACAALEQAGLNPLILLNKEHAYPGVWLRAEEFSTVTVDDITALRKRVALQEMVLFESTLLTSQTIPSFTHATQVGAQHVDETEEESFQLALDIRRARLHRIKPLASPEAATVYERAMPGSALDLSEEETPEFLAEVDLPDQVPAELDPKDRLARWQRKLLDLSLRNNLLNFRETRKTLRLEVPNPGALEALLSEGESVKILSLPELMSGSDPREKEIHERREHELVQVAHATEALKRREVFIALGVDEMEGRLVEQFRAARAALEEGGANTLFLAYGFLSWNRKDKPGQRLKAPLILVPVTLNRRSVRSGFTLTLHEDEPRFNPTLIEMLRQDLSLSLGIGEGELSREDGGLDIASLWKTVERAVKDIPGWEVRHEVVLALFSFAKHLMWKDLAERTDQLRANPVVRHLLDTPREAYVSEIDFPEPRSLDREFGPEQVFCPLQADSSQLSAVLAAAKGKDFVLIGPPGTGKSQTIANLIAQCLAEGKKVLFVSEKIAALDVVYRRLKEVGLGEFCLELHSNKTRKQEVLERLQLAWSARGDVDVDVWRAEAERLRGLREGLNTYVHQLHTVQRNGLTVFRAIAQVAAGEDVPRLGLGWSSSSLHDRQDLDGLRDLVGRLEVNARAVGDLVAGAHPLQSLACAEWSPIWQQHLVRAASTLSDLAAGLQKAALAFLEATGLPTSTLRPHVREGLGILARVLPEAHGRDWRFTLRSGANALGEQLEAGVALVAKHRTLTGLLSPGWSPETIRSCQEGLTLLACLRELKAKLEPGFHPDVVEALQQGLRLVESLEQEDKNLSVRYTDRVESLNIFILQRTWHEGQASRWPLSWLKKRKVAKALVAVAQGEGRIVPERDVHTLARMRSLLSRIDALDLAGATDGIWNGRKTNLRNGYAAVRFQEALTQARHDLSWQDKGFEPVAEGRCGERLARQLTILRSIAAKEAAIASLDDLQIATQGLWEGLATRVDRLEAALLFLSDLESVRESGSMAQAHDLVATGACGETLRRDLNHLQERSQLEARIAGYRDLAERTAGLWAGLSTDGAEVALALSFMGEVKRAVATWAGSLEQSRQINSALESLLGDGNHLLEPTGSTMTRGRDLLAAQAPLPEALREVVQLGCLGPEARRSLEDQTPEELTGWGQALIRQEVRLRAWCAWQKARKEGEVGGLGPLIRAIEEGRVAPGGLRRAFETDYCRWWLNAHVDGDDVIRSFVSVEHEQRISDFRALEKRFTDLTRNWVRASLCAGIPDPEKLPRNSDWGTLRREVAKKKRHLPLRTLLGECPHAVTTLAPCLLMSPLSIAQYLAPNSDAFDLVVFDEASQIPVWDAIGAIARGRQVVMVGDPKQLPPTNFFNRADAEPDDVDVEEDLESILDECLGASLPTLELNWHYRSRHESLIAFSNFHYYKGQLITFPSPVTRDNAVSLHPVNGVYERSGARINKPEATALVDDVVRRLRSGEFLRSRLTIGIVTFNAEQKTLIENLLDDARRRYPSIEPYFSDSELEPVFVKNLESVQGDERDIIYFSTTYGPDHSGVVSMNFGPLNRDGGERRLNVAITRARQELRVFSSMSADQINLSRTQALGVRDLKYFLDFAERGSRALAEEARLDREGFDSPFEEAVAKALQRKGWDVRTQVGVSVFRIDLAVVHPDFPGAFLAGIECDGATYHRSATARDRDLLRERQLRNLGWEILRVWSTDWWIDPAGTLDDLHQKLEQQLELSRTNKDSAEEPSPAVVPTTDASDPQQGIQMVATAWHEFAPRVSTAVSPEEEAVTPADSQPEVAIASMDPEVFFRRAYDSTLTMMIGDIVEAEGPILDASLAKKIARRHGWQRTGSRIQERVESLASRNHRSTRENVGRFFWPKSLGPGAPVPARKNWALLNRTVDEICIQELMTLAGEVQRMWGSDGSTVTLMSRALGLGRLTSGVRERLEQALRAMEAEDTQKRSEE